MDDWPPVAEAIALYAQGWFPMDADEHAGDPLPFYAVDERAVFDLSAGARAALRRRVRRSLRARADCELVRDRHFERVLASCAEPRDADDGVWITPRLAALYRRMHAAGHAHSYELVRGDELAAGVLAVRLGRAAMLESMRHLLPDAGNALLSRLLDALAEDEGVTLCDIQLPSDHTLALGAQLIGRADYERQLLAALS